MKFFTVLSVALLAMNVAAYNNTREDRNAHTTTTTTTIHSAQASYPAQFAEFFQYVIEAIVEFVPQPFANFMEIFYEAFQKFAEFFPAELKVAFNHVVETLPSFQELYTPEFRQAVSDFYRAIKNFFSTHQFYNYLNEAFEAFPSVEEFFPAEFFLSFANHLKRIPHSEKFIQQWIMALKHMINKH